MPIAGGVRHACPTCPLPERPVARTVCRVTGGTLFRPHLLSGIVPLIRVDICSGFQVQY